MPGSVVRSYREMKNYSQKYIAAQMGISQNAYSKIENNVTQLTVRHVKQLSEILDIPITELIKDEFELHGPVHILTKVSKADVLMQIETLKKKTLSKQSLKNEAEIAVISLLTAAETKIASVL